MASPRMAVRTARSRAGNLPAELTSFVGRRHELAEIKRLLTTTRLLTLTGTGGAGKTRLALRAAADLSRSLPDGAWLVALAPIDDPLLITQAVFSALGVPDVSSRFPLSALSDHLREKRLLLVLDNCEHLLDGAAGLAGSLLRSCPELRILATSRQALAMPGEVRHRVQPLSLPEAAESSNPGQIAGSDAVALLVERASAVQPGFTVDESNAATVLQICARLEGMPLALELAAVRLEGLSVDQLLAVLDRELLGPDAVMRGAETRQRTMEATLDWSHSLLSEPQRRAWARLSVFAGGFGAEAAEAVCAGLESSPGDVPGVLAALVESSILSRDHGTQPPRYSMPETVRQYGRRRLRELGEELELQTRHRDWVLGLAEATATFDDTNPQTFDAIHRERDNLWSALEHCRRQPGDAAAGVVIVASLTNYWMARGPLRDIRRYLESLLPLTEPDSDLRARALVTAALFSSALDDATTGQAHGAEAQRIAGVQRRADVACWAAGALLFTAFVQGKHDGVGELCRSMIETGGETGMGVIARHYTSLHWLQEGRVDEAIEMGEAGVAICKRVGDLYSRGLILNTLAEARRRRGELAEARDLAREGVVCKQALDDRRGVAALTETLAWVAADARDDSRAATLLGCAQSLRDSIAIPLLTPYAPHHRACEAGLRERLGEAQFRKVHHQGLAMSAAEAIDYVLGRAEPRPAPTAPRTATVLSRRELEIARLVAEGLTNREIAAQLFISNRTVETHVTNMLNKLGISTRTQLARWVE
jgi:predicted ATPase/DNA-binding CsgD family transcriptional regulator